MSRSICFCEPNIARAGEVSIWKFIYTPGANLKKGARLKFDLMSTGRDIDWKMPSIDLKEKSNVIFLTLKDETVVKASQVEVADRYTPQFEFKLPCEVKAGQSLTISIGSPKNSKIDPSKNGNKCQTIAQRKKPFKLYIDSQGNGNYETQETFTLDIKGNKLSQITIIAPSLVARNKRFDVIARFEDEYGNLTNLAPEDTLIELTYEHLRKNLNWKLFIPETGFIEIPNLYFNEIGIYRIQLQNMNNNERFFSSPIRCNSEAAEEIHIFWGSLHSESEKIDSTENIESCLRHIRDEKAYNFFATSPFGNSDEISDSDWKKISQNVSEFNESDRFACLLGLQWKGEASKEGIRSIIYNSDSKPLLKEGDMKYSSLKKIYKSFTPKEIISIPSFTMGSGVSFNFKEFNSEYERVAEIYNAWGSSETTQKKGNILPITGSCRKSMKEAAEGSFTKALINNCRFGFVAGGLDDRNFYENFYETEQDQYLPGLTAIISKDLSRDAIFKALHARSCYATTGARILLGFNIANISMGNEISTTKKPGLKINRHISGYAAGTSELESIEIIRNGEIIKSINPQKEYFHDFTYDDMTDLSKSALSKDKKSFSYYYIKVSQKDGHTAWSSPIWIDLE